MRLTRWQIEDSPPLAEHAPVSAAYEAAYWGYYSGPPYNGLAPYGVGPGGFGALPWAAWSGSPAMPGLPPDLAAAREELARKLEEHLRSVVEVIGYGIAAADRDIGEVDDFVVDDLTWVLRYLVVDTGRWLPGRNLGGAALAGSHRLARTAPVRGLNAERIRDAPEFDPAVPIDRRYETTIIRADQR